MMPWPALAAQAASGVGQAAACARRIGAMQPPSSKVPVRAAGGVLWRGSPQAPEIAVIYRPRRDDWTLPKGKLDPGETEIEAALREVAEETGAVVTLGRHLGGVRYEIDLDGKSQRKLVTYWAMQAVGGEFAPNAEVDELRWLPPAEAMALLTRDSDQDVLGRFLSGPAEVGRVLLLRHAEAQPPHSGPDETRALSSVGRTRAARLAGVLQALAPAVLHCSPAQRCAETLAPAAALLALAPQQDARFAEGAGRGNGTAEQLVQRGQNGEAVLVCSHAPVIVAMLEHFCRARPALLPQPARLDAGGIWAADFAPDGLVGLQYLPPPAV